MEWNGVLRHVSTERLFCAENGELIDWCVFYGTATLRYKQVIKGRCTVEKSNKVWNWKYVSEWLLTNRNELLLYLVYILFFSDCSTESEKTMKLLRSKDVFNLWNSQKMIWNLRQGVRIQRDVEFHHSLLRAQSTAPIHGTDIVRPNPTDDTRAEWNGMVFYGTQAQKCYFVPRTVNWLIDLGFTALQQTQATQRRCTMKKT